MLRTNFLGVDFDNPIVLASGILGLTAASLKKAVDDGCGGVTGKSLSAEPRPGHPNPTMTGTKNYFITAVGLSNPGIEEGILELKKYREICSAPIIASIFAGSSEGFATLAEKLEDSPSDFIELNLSCPNVNLEFGKPFAYSVEAVEEITKKTRARTKKPFSVKLSPNAWNIAELAKAAEAAGADAITAVNTVSGMMIDVRLRAPVLHNKQGGVSGPVLFPIALKCVYDIYEAVKIPIIGTGGVTSGEDALAMIMAGASLVGVGTAVYYRGADAFKKITEEMEKIMNEEGINTLAEIRGTAHA